MGNFYFFRWVCEFGTSKCFWDWHSVQGFFWNKASALHRHFGHSVQISWRQIGNLVSLCWVWVSSGMFYAGFSIYFFTWFCEFGTSKCFWDLHSVKVFFSVIKAWVLHRHFAQSVPISWRKIDSLAPLCWVWVSSGMFYAWFMYFILNFLDASVNLVPLHLGFT